MNRLPVTQTPVRKSPANAGVTNSPESKYNNNGETTTKKKKKKKKKI